MEELKLYSTEKKISSLLKPLHMPYCKQENSRRSVGDPGQ